MVWLIENYDLNSIILSNLDNNRKIKDIKKFQVINEFIPRKGDGRKRVVNGNKFRIYRQYKTSLDVSSLVKRIKFRIKN